jgi:[histone H3]-trimethyl-L-lysine4 demethylase
MTKREFAGRRSARDAGCSEILEEKDRAEEQYQCTFCKVFCYLSQMTCSCTTKIACFDHAELLCQVHGANAVAHQRVLRKRFPDEYLQDTLNKVSERAAVPGIWLAKFKKLLAENERPPLRSLRALLAEGERINHAIPELEALRKCVTRANEWLEEATPILRKTLKKRQSRPASGRRERDGKTATEYDEDRHRTLNELLSLIAEVEHLGFDCPEAGTLAQIAQQAQAFKDQAAAVLEKYREGTTDEIRNEILDNCKALVVEGSSLNVFLDEMVELERIVAREDIMTELEDKAEDTTLTLENVRHLLTKARMCGIAPENRYIKILEEKQRAGSNWEERAQHILDQPYKTLEELNEFADVSHSTPIDPVLLDRLNAFRTKGLEFEKQAKAWLLPPTEDAPKPKIIDVERFVKRCEKDFSIPVVQDLKRTAEFALDLETRCEQVLSGRYEHRESTDVFDTFQKWSAYGKEHLNMFFLPVSERFDQELELHYRWLRDLPWNAHNGKDVYNDVLECTKPDDDLPPADEFFTCICNQAVRPPPPGTVSDAVQCDHCFARFHGLCAATGGSCPFCDHHHWNGTIHKERRWHYSFLPPILMSAPEITMFYSQEWKDLEVIVHRLDRLCNVVGQFLSFCSLPGNQRTEYIHQVRHYMRKLYKIQFAVATNREVSFGLDLAGLHRILAAQPAQSKQRKKRKAKFTFGQDLDKDWLDGTRCICRGRTDYLLHYPTIACESCNHKYHTGCVFYPPPPVNSRFICPLCCIRKNKVYPYSEVRVKHIGMWNPSDLALE